MVTRFVIILNTIDFEHWLRLSAVVSVILKTMMFIYVFR